MRDPDAVRRGPPVIPAASSRARVAAVSAGSRRAGPPAVIAASDGGERRRDGHGRDLGGQPVGRPPRGVLRRGRPAAGDTRSGGLPLCRESRRHHRLRTGPRPSGSALDPRRSGWRGYSASTSRAASTAGERCRSSPASRIRRCWSGSSPPAAAPSCMGPRGVRRRESSRWADAPSPQPTATVRPGRVRWRVGAPSGESTESGRRGGSSRGGRRALKLPDIARAPSSGLRHRLHQRHGRKVVPAAVRVAGDGVAAEDRGLDSHE